MKKSFLLIILIIFCIYNASQASELVNPKSQALLDDIRIDISDSMSRIMDFESSEWNVYLSKPEENNVSLGIIVEPSSKTVLSVSSQGMGASMGLKVGDILKRITINSVVHEKSYQRIEASSGDKVSAFVTRDGANIELNTVIPNNVTPHWQLFASPSNELVFDTENNQLKTQMFQSNDSVEILEKLQGRINLMLSDIQRLEAEADNVEFQVDLSQKTKSETRFGITIDKTTNQVIRVDEGGSADSLMLQPGDYIKSIRVNGERLKDISELTLADGDKLDVSVERDNQQLNLTTQVQSKLIPAWRFVVEKEAQYPDTACGVVTLLMTPKIAQDIYNVEAAQLDGDNVISSKVIFKLKAGAHSFKLYDKIPSDKVVSSFRQRRPYKVGKTFEVKIEPNKRYYLAAKFDRTKRWKTKDGEYWEPMLWKVEDYECSL
ncbi:hypothetical protein [Kangiella spongicola]|uniref:PDZ domain-containing protein n=1 Tax=Kangiella spongicola TaxID=796379 RepID=A0A318D7P5_9GAMM|nr:hypothetical protein [Kangiella spongicola]PXF62897.1 hypothetical protein DL796_11350 [Kangiella spongicola]